MEYTAYYNSPIGKIEISATDTHITSLMFYDAKKEPSPHKKETIKKSKVLIQCIKELREYFTGKRKVFSVLCMEEGTEFEEKVWKKIWSISYGKTLSYKDIAEKIKNPAAFRAVANATGDNRLYLLVPCHRVVGTNNKVTGYGGDLWRKEWLLNHEKENSK